MVFSYTVIEDILKGDKGDTGPQGNQGVQGIQGIQGIQGEPGISSSIFTYTFSTQTSGTVADGNVYVNFSPVSGATSMRISHKDKSGHDIDQILRNVNDASHIIIQRSTNSEIYVDYIIFSKTIGTGYIDYGLTFDNRAGTLGNNDEVIVILQLSGLTGPQGIQGVAGTNATNPNFTASVTSSGSGVTPAVSLTGTYPNLALGFALKNGTDGTNGSAGTAATIAVGTVTTGAAGSSAIITNSGTSSAAVFNFTIPKGDTGSSGSSSYVFEPNNMSDGGQVTIGAFSFYKCFFAPTAFTTTQLRYAKLTGGSTTIYFALYNSAGTLLATASQTSSIQGYNTTSWSVPVSFTTGQQYYFSHSNTSALSTLVYGVSVGGSTNVPSLFYWQAASWTSNIAPSTITVATGNTIPSAIMWHMLI